MNLGTLLSFAAFLLQFWMGVFFAVIARAPGWSRARIYTLLALSAACFSAINILFSVEWLPLETIRVLGSLNFFFAALHVSAWLVVSAAEPERPLRSLPTRFRWLVGLTLLFGLVAAVPSISTSSEFTRVEVPALHVTYRQPHITVYANAFVGWLLLMLLVPFTRFVRSALRGDHHARVRVIGFSVYFLCALDEVLVTSGVIEFLYLADVGLLAMVVTLMIETLRQVMRDAEALKRAGEQLTQERDQAREALIIAERHAALGQFAAGIGHEINNPLTYVRGNLEHVQRSLLAGNLGPDALPLLEEAITGAEQIQRVVGDLRSYVLPSTERREPVDVSEELEAALKLASTEIGMTTQVDRDYDEHELVLADSHRLRQVFVNLLLNAGIAIRQAKPAEPRLRVRVWMSDALELTVEIRDNGVGVPEAALKRLGEPYFSSRLDRGGSGLGLFVSRGILESLGGRLSFESKLGLGTTARVTLPTLGSTRVPVSVRQPSPSSQPQATSNRAALAAALQGPVRVLVVDDDPSVARAIARQLGGAEVSVAHYGRAAIERLLVGEPVDLVLCDVMMPGESGRDVYEAVAAARPELLHKLVFVTGGATIPEIAEFLAQKGVRHLSKPIQRAELDALLKSRALAPS